VGTAGITKGMENGRDKEENGSREENGYKREICGLRADYRIQAHLNDKIFPVVYKQDKVCTVALNNEDGKPYSVVSVTYR
jgi:hypothetical protein